jgi:hypothetical protein
VEGEEAFLLDGPVSFFVHVLELDQEGRVWWDRDLCPHTDLHASVLPFWGAFFAGLVHFHSPGSVVLVSVVGRAIRGDRSGALFADEILARPPSGEFLTAGHG